MDQQYVRLRIFELSQLLGLNSSLIADLTAKPFFDRKLLDELIIYQFHILENLRELLVAFENANDQIIERFDELLYQMHLQAILYDAKIAVTKSK